MLVPGAWTTKTACEELGAKLSNLVETVEVNADSILGACDVGNPLANRMNWSLLSHGFGKFGGDGSNGNGFLLGGDAVVVGVKKAGYDEFGTADPADRWMRSPIVANSGSVTWNQPIAFTPYPIAISSAS